MPETNAIDCSVYSGPVSQPQAEALYADGIRLAIIGSGHPNSLGRYSQQQAETFTEAGMEVHGYRWFNLDEPIGPQCDNALASFGGALKHVTRMWPDFEDANMGSMLTPSVVVDRCTEVMGRFSGYFPGVYTGSWWWVPRTGNSPMLADYDLWNAYYPTSLPGSTEGNLPYGGWTESAIWQFKGTTLLHGFSVDLNYVKAVDSVPLDAGNSIAVITRDLTRWTAGKHPVSPTLHRLLRDQHGYDAEYTGDYGELGI